MEYTLPELEAFGKALNENNKFDEDDTPSSKSTEKPLEGKEAVNQLRAMGLVN